LAAGLGSDVQIIHTDGCSQLFQGTTNGTVVLSGHGRIRQDFSSTGEILDHLQIGY
jgi:hypothetical protein